MKSERGTTPASEELMKATQQWTALPGDQTAVTTTNTKASHFITENPRQMFGYKRVASPIIGDKASFLYRLLDVGPNKKVPLSLPKTVINEDDLRDDNSSVPQRMSNSVQHLDNSAKFKEKEEIADENSFQEASQNHQTEQLRNCVYVREEVHIESPGKHSLDAGEIHPEADVHQPDMDAESSTTDISSNIEKAQDDEIAETSKEEEEKSTPVETRRSSSSNKDSPPRKVSFKVRGSSVSSRRGKYVESRVMLSSNTVAALTTKFNALIHDNDSSRKHDPDCKTLVMIPQNKKQGEIKVIVSRKNSNVKKDASVTPTKCTVAKKQLTNTTSQQDDIKGAPKDIKRKISITYRPSILGTRSGNVKAAIQIFEQNASQLKTKSYEKHNSVQSSNTTKVEQVTFKGIDFRHTNVRKLQPEMHKAVDGKLSDSKQKESDNITKKVEVIGSERKVLEEEEEVEGHLQKSAQERNSENDVTNRVVEDVSLAPERIQCEDPVVQDETSVSNVTVIAVRDRGTEGEDDKRETALKEKNDYMVSLKKDVKTKDICETIECSDNCGTNSPVVPEFLAGEPSKDTREEREECHYKVLVDNMKPNNSFLWRSTSQAPPLPPKKPQIVPVEQIWRYSADAAPSIQDRPPIQEPSNTEESSLQEDIYDDIHPISSIYSCGEDAVGHSYSTVDDNTYDDVGYKLTEVHTANPEPEDGYEYCTVPPYDDCEGEGYQFIGEGAQHEEEDIYDDVKSVTTLRISDETASISNCYESIYSGRRPPQRCNGSSASSSTRSGQNSSCDQTNSLYGIGGSRFDSASVSQASTASGEYGPVTHEVWSYQLTAPGQPRSETSDEWVDVEPSDSEVDDPGRGQGRTIVLVQERSRNRRSPSWSRKVRNQWSKSRNEGNGDICISSSSVLYLGEFNIQHENKPGPLCMGTSGFVSLRAILYIGDTQESQEMTFFLGKEGGENSSDSDDHHYEMLEDVTGPNGSNHHNNVTGVNTDNMYDDFDSFDSDDSDTYMKPLNKDDYGPGSGRLPEPPPGQNIYGITKIAEVAGKKMLKLGRSLRRIGPKRTSGSRDVHLTVSPQAPAVPPPRPPSASQPASQPATTVPSTTLEKSSSASNLSGRKTWTLRSRFKRSNSSSGGQLNSTSPKTSTFYLTPPVNADTGAIENGGSSSKRQSVPEAPTENGNVPTSPSSCSSTKTLTYDSGTDVTSSTVQNAANKSRSSAPSGRRGSRTVRPNSPPPLPPLAAGDTTKRSNKKEKKISNTSWYTECGLFDRTDVQNSSSSDIQKKAASKTDKPISNSWYAAVGLWDMTPSSPNDSSLSEHDTSQHTDVSDSSTSQENSGIIQRRFLDEPLYQFYTASVVEMAKWGMGSDFDSDGYEEIGDKMPKTQVRPSAMELIRPREGQHRTLWCEIPEVVNSRVLSTLSAHQKKLQEAKFEIITSEASYMNSLNVLEHHFMSSLELNDETILSKNDRRILFGNVVPVKSCSERFLADLERCWQDNILLHGICDTIYQHATSYFSIYIKYCSNQIYLDRTLRRLKEQHGRFAEVLNQLESSPKCQSLSLHSFLMLPMQRVTRLPLLIDAVLTRLDPKDDEYKSCELALATLNKIVQDCNEGARCMERMEEILILSRQLDFPREVKHVPIISSSRWLVRSGELIQLVWRGDDAKLTFGKKFSKVTLHVFLFTDLLVITKKKSEDCYTVLDHCPRNLVQIVSAEGMSNLPVKFTSDSGRNLMLLTMLQNHEKKTVEMIMSCPLESDRQRWLEAVSQPTSDNPDETVYEEWDCPQVTAIHPYTACQPDELSLDVSDVVNVLRKMSDGWYQGERIRDGERGWFPGNYTVEIASAHVRARNLKQRYRLLALSGNFLDSQRKEKHTK